MLPIILSFDLDDELSTRNAFQSGNFGINDPNMGIFGSTIGYANILDVLKRFNVPSTFFLIGQSANRYKNTIRTIARAGHELGNHSFSHRGYNHLTFNETFEEINKTNDIIFELTGKRPCSHRSPYWQSNIHVQSILNSLNFKWSGDAHVSYDDENVLQLHRSSDGLIEIPSSPRQGDWSNFLIKKLTVKDVLNLWIRQLEKCKQHSNVFTLVCHPFIIGRTQYLSTLEDFLLYVTSRPHEYKIMTGEYLEKYFLQ